MAKPTGYTLHESADIVVIATLASDNRKTGDMVQVWILAREVSPVVAVKTGTDSLICGDCKHRGIDGAKRTCYVNVGQGPNSVWKAWTRGNYPTLALADYARVFHGRAIRLGAYGDPAMVPVEIVAELTRVSTRHTGYTHQWRNTPALREFVMASVDNTREFDEARALGWRTFRVSSTLEARAGEILCPASEEGGKRTQCARCGLCDGSRANDARKSIFIPVHGTGKVHFAIIGQ